MTNTDTSNGDGAAVTNDAPTEIIASMPECFLDVYVLYSSGFKYAEIAQGLNIPIGTVRSRLHRARAYIRKHHPTSPTAEDTLEGNTSG